MKLAHRAVAIVLFLLFFLSGFCSLLYQVVPDSLRTFRRYYTCSISRSFGIYAWSGGWVRRRRLAVPECGIGRGRHISRRSLWILPS